MSIFSIISIPIISAAIGWFTNYVAIKMLFHPREPKNLYFFTLQGIFPKRKEVLAERLGRIVARDLFSMDKVKEKLDNPSTREQIKEAIITELHAFLVAFKANNKMLGMFLQDSTIEQILQKVGAHLDETVPKLTGKFAMKLEEVNVEQIVFEKVSNFSNEKIEQMLMVVISKELKFIELIGGVLGFIIGLIQVGLVMLGEHYQI